ncbi:MAG: class I SAM-dependent methyltransferase [Chloroflexi bacterium]|nr:class I SAM-dependent methyltransferase [Chloroflexota bacterium]MCY3939224.1 class I SAM-dependent methyltransferase [Chloroflexota bacterium]
MHFIVPENMDRYADDHSSPLPPVLEELKDYTYANIRGAGMISDKLVGGLLQTLIFASGARHVLELGLFTGFSALMMAHALPEDGTVTSCDIDPEAERRARRFFDKTPHGKKITVRIGPALETLEELTGPYDLIFIDADKVNYPAYYERCLELLAANGVMVVDNVLWSGRVLDPQSDDDKAIDALNKRVASDPRVHNVLLTIRDGLNVIRKR